MVEDYCEKHEWPAGMSTPCPNCAELAVLQAKLDETLLKVEALTKPDTGHWSSVALALKAAQKDLAAANLQVDAIRQERDGERQIAVDWETKYHKLNLHHGEHHKDRQALELQVDAWKRYHALLAEELRRAVGMAYIHGWRSTPEHIEAGKKLRAELGLPDTIDKRKDEPSVADAAIKALGLCGCGHRKSDHGPLHGEIGAGSCIEKLQDGFRECCTCEKYVKAR